MFGLVSLLKYVFSIFRKTVKSFLFKTIFVLFCFHYIYWGEGWHMCLAFMWRSVDSRWGTGLSLSTLWVLRIQLRSLGLTTSALTCCTTCPFIVLFSETEYPETQVSALVCSQEQVWAPDHSEFTSQMLGFQGSVQAFPLPPNSNPIEYINKFTVKLLAKS